MSGLLSKTGFSSDAEMVAHHVNTELLSTLSSCTRSTDECICVYMYVFVFMGPSSVNVAPW